MHLRHAPLILALAALPQTSGAQMDYAARRAALAAQLPDSAVLLALGAGEPAEDFLSFNQSPSFQYLTGLQEPEAAMVMVKRGATVSSTMFVLPNDPSREVWTGARLGVSGVTRLTSVPARTRDQLRPVLDSLLASSTTLYVVGAGGASDGATTPEQQYVQSLHASHPTVAMADADRIVMQLRGHKSPNELELIRKAVAITVAAQREAMASIEPGQNEFETQALIEYTFRRNGADRPSFSTIVGSGPNSTTLHYNRDDRFMNAGEVTVMDIGASYRGYAADVTRTVPVSGKFSPDQRTIYQLVRDGQAAGERQAKVGVPARAMSDSANAVLAAGLTRLGLIESPAATYDCSPDGARQCRQLSLYYMHSLGHGIGLEVHDPDQYYFTGVIQPGSAFTIEPGIYVRANLLEILPKTARNQALIEKIGASVRRYANIGVRIEDDYIVTDRGVEWISRAPREVSEVEAAMKVPFRGPAPRDSAKVEWYRAGSR